MFYFFPRSGFLCVFLSRTGLKFHTSQRVSMPLVPPVIQTRVHPLPPDTVVPLCQQVAGNEGVTTHSHARRILLTSPPPPPCPPHRPDPLAALARDEEEGVDVAWNELSGMSPTTPRPSAIRSSLSHAVQSSPLLRRCRPFSDPRRRISFPSVPKPPFHSPLPQPFVTLPLRPSADQGFLSRGV